MLFFLFSIVFVILSHFSFHINFRIHIIASWNFDWNWAEPADQVGENWDLSHIESSNFWTWNIYPFIYIFFDFFYRRFVVLLDLHLNFFGVILKSSVFLFQIVYYCYIGKQLTLTYGKIVLWPTHSLGFLSQCQQVLLFGLPLVFPVHALPPAHTPKMWSWDCLLQNYLGCLFESASPISWVSILGFGV